MDRPIIYSQEISRAYDLLKALRYTQRGLGQLAADLLIGGLPPTVASGFVATPAAPLSLSINIGAGAIYQIANADTTAYGTLTSDLSQIVQQGVAAAQVLTLSTSALSSGQSQWALVEVTFQQIDVVPADDPSGGVLPYVNPINPQSPYAGPNNTGAVQNSARTGVAHFQIAYGAAAQTGSEVPPGVDAGYVPLYLIDLNFGQTTISAGQIKVAGPATVAGYTQAPFLAGLLGKHHLGLAGTAPQIDLTTEVKNVLALANLPATDTTGLLPTIRFGTFSSPNGNVGGSQGDFWLNTSTGALWTCGSTGPATGAGQALWFVVSGVQPPFGNAILGGPLLSGVTAGTGIAVSAAPAAGVALQTVNVANAPNTALAGPVLSGITPGAGILVSGAPSSGTGSPTVAATDLGHLFTGGGISASGYWKGPGGLIIQWVSGAQVTTGDDFSATLTFAIPFPNACLAAVVSSGTINATDFGNGGIHAADCFFQIVSFNATTVQVQAQTGGQGGQQPQSPLVVAFGF